MVDALTENQQIAVALVPKLTSVISIGSLLYALRSFFRNWSKRGKLYHRLFLSLAISDLIRSINFFIGSWAVPVGEPNVFMALGNDATCTAQAIVFQLGQVVPIYLTSLCFYAYLAVRNDFKDAKMAWAEKWIHLIALAVPLLLTILMVALNIHGISDGGTRCWIADAHWDVKDCLEGEDECSSRKKFGYHFLLQKLVHNLCVIFCITIFVRLVLMERRFRWENRAVMGKMRLFEQARSCKSTHIIRLSFFYLLSLVFCFIVNDLTRFISRASRNINEPTFAVELIGTICMTLSGMVNVIIYFGQVNSSVETVDCAKYSIRQSIKSIASINIVAGGYKPKKQRRSLNFFNQEKSPADFGIFMGNDGDDESSDDDNIITETTATDLSNSVSKHDDELGKYIEVVFT